MFESNFFWYTTTNISCEIFSKIIHFRPKGKSKEEETQILIEINFTKKGSYFRLKLGLFGMLKLAKATHGLFSNVL